MQLLLVLTLIALIALLGVLERRHRHAVRRLHALARTDELTGLPNRRAWQEELNREIARSTRLGTPVTVGLLDLDRFKHYNDKHGHQAGDRLLRSLAHMSTATLRTTDVLARYGGEEFALILPYCTIDSAHDIVERMRASIPENQTCSAGIASWNGHESLEQLMERADEALYTAKRGGRNRTVLAPKRNGDSP